MLCIWLAFAVRRDNVEELDAAAVNHYATLGLDRSCTTAQIRSAYRQLVKRHHPDRNRDSADASRRAQELNAAHEVLSDPARRRAYERELDDARTGPALSRRAERNVARDVNLRLADFFRGVSLEVQITDPGNLDGTETYLLAIPPQTAPGARFPIPRRVPFAGGYVLIRVRPSPDFRFKVRGSDLRYDLRISSRRAAEGGTETIYGPLGNRLPLKIPARVARGELLRILGEGLPKLRGGRGDLIVRVSYRPEVRIARREPR